jgi:hypothetical protein
MDAIDQLGEFSGQGSLADPGHAGQEQGMRDAPAAGDLPEKKDCPRLRWNAMPGHKRAIDPYSCFHAKRV